MQKDNTAYHILVIEDNVGDYFLIEEYFSENLFQHHLVQVETFQEAKRRLSDKSEKWDAIFLDLSLPDHSGEGLIVDVLNMAIGVPVIALTGFSDLEFSKKSLSLGISDYLLKDELNSTVLYKTLIYAIQRKKIISNLQLSEKKYSDLFQLSPIPMLVYDQKSSLIVDVNQAAIEKYGYTRQEFQAIPPMTLWKNPTFDNLSGFLKEKSKKSKHEHQIKTGELITVEIDSASIHYGDESADLILVNDITEKNQYIQTIEKQNQTFHEIAWIQSHIVRAPLARLMGLVNVLEFEKDPNSKEYQDLIEYIRVSVEELDMIIRDISKKSELVITQNTPQENHES